MRDTPFEPHKLNVTALARAQALIEGEVALSALPRLAASVADDATSPAIWSAQGSYREPAGRDVEVRLHLRASMQVPLTCQRCLERLWQPLTVDRLLRFVPTEAQAEALDEVSEDEDVLVLPRKLNLPELVEDELILALPIVPRHETCPTDLLAHQDPVPDEVESSAESADTPHPFAALAALRKPT
jgi:uncharacterized protein